MLVSINYDLKKSINKAGIDKQVKAAQVCHFWHEAIRGIFGQEIAKKSQAIKFKNGALTVAVLSSVLAQEFKFKEDEIKTEINKKVGYNLVRKIRFEI